MKERKIKMYVNEKELNEYEKEHKKVSFRRIFDRFFTDAILCNNIPNVLYENMELEIGTDYNEETEEYTDIYQYFIVDFNNWSYDKMKEFLQDEIILYYVNELDIYVLGVTHFGTGWDYVLTDIEYVTNLEEADF